MSQADREKWELRYREGRGYQAAPDPFLDRVASRFLVGGGRALDLAGGTGRHARWLAQRGFHVTLCDISSAALEEGARLARAEGLALEVFECDLDETFPPGPWDVVLVSFFLVRGRFSAIVSSLAPGGHLVIIHPTLRNLERHDKPTARWLFEEGELNEGVPGLRTLHQEEGWGERGRHEIRYLGKRITGD